MPTRPHRATYEFAYASPDEARVVADAVQQEVGEIDDPRSRTHLQREGTALHVDVEAADLVALRAATNTWLSLVGVAERVTDLTGVDDTNG